MSYQDDRKEYRAGILDDSMMTCDPMELFSSWLAAYRDTGAEDATAFALSTVSAQLEPDARIVLLKGLTEGKMLFYTHYTSKKGKDLAAHPVAHALFFWPSMERQMRVFGSVSKVTPEESSTYFHSRPVMSSRGAIASDQSKMIESRAALDVQLQTIEKTEDANLQRPTTWGGYVLEISKIEFWQGRPSRMHDRLVFTLTSGEWTVQRLQP